MMRKGGVVDVKESLGLRWKILDQREEGAPISFRFKPNSSALGKDQEGAGDGTESIST